MLTKAPCKPVGRPLAEIDYVAIAEMAKLGLAIETIADRLGVDRRTLYNHLGKNAELKAAYNAGVADLVAVAAGKLRDMVERGDLGAVIFTLRTKGGFVVPKQEVAVTVSHAAGPLIDGHISDLANHHAALLDGPDLDSVPDAEIVE